MHVGKWHRYFGKRISSTIGIIGVGRIGKGVINRLQSFSKNILTIFKSINNFKYSMKTRFMKTLIHFRKII